MKGKFRIFGRLWLALFLVSALLLMAAPVAAATAVNSVWVDFEFGDTQNIVTDSGANVYVVHFKPAVALVKGVDWVTVTFPDGSSAMGPAAFASIGTVVATDLEFSTDFGTAFSATWKRSTSDAVVTQFRVKIKTPIDVAIGADVWIRISSTAIVADSSVSNSYKVYVQTTKDTTRVLSSAFSLDSTAINATNDALVVTPNTAGVAAEYKFVFQTGTSGATTVTVKLPVGVGMPSSMDITEVLFSLDGSSWFNASSTPVVDAARRTVTAATSLTLTTGSDNYMKIIQGAGVTNPTLAKVANAYRVAMKTIADGTWAYLDVATAIVADTATQIIVANGEIGLSSKSYSDDAAMINSLSSEIFVTLADQYGNAKATTATVTMSTSGTGEFYISNNDAPGSGTYSLATSLSVTVADPVKKETQAFYRGTVAETVTLTFAHASYTDATWTFKVAPAVSLYDSVDNLLNTYGPTGTGVSELGRSGGSIGTTQKYGVDYINSAITASGDGDTVKLGDGIYELDATISLNKKITLTSVNGASSTTLRNTANTFDKGLTVGISGTAANPVIIDGFTFQRLRSGMTFERAVYSDGYDYVTVRNNIFNYIEPNVQFDSSTPGAVVFIGTRNVSADITSATVSNNTFNNCVTTWPDLGSGAKAAVIGFQTFSATYTLTGGTISGNTINNSYGIGIGLNGYNSDGYITASITNNTITNGYSAIQIERYSQSVSVTGNTITNAYSYGVKVSGTITTGLVIKNNTITNTVGDGNGAGIRIQTVTSVSPIVQYNDITGSNTYAIKVDSGVGANAVDSKYNYYGDASGPSYTALTGAEVSKSNPNGAGDIITDRVTYYPWLHKSLATVVADNASYPTFSRSLVVGWNTLSVPGKLISTADSLDEMIPTGMTIAYKYDTGAWVQVTTATINPLDAVYVKMASAQTVLLKVDGAAFSVPTKSLATGWTLIGLASLTSRTDLVATASIPSTSFGQMVSPSMNASEWVFVTSGAGTLVVGEGYWIYLSSAATIAGFTILPMAPSLS